MPRVNQTSHRTRQRMEIAARLESMGVPDVDIARHVGLTYAGLAQLKQRHEYKTLRVQVASGILSMHDVAIGEDINELRAKIRQNAPVAIQAIIDTINQKTDPKLRLQASKDLLALDDRLAKVSKHEHTFSEKDISDKDSSIANNLATALGSVKLKSQAIN